MPRLTLDRGSEPGHAMLIALMTFMIISLLGTIIVEVGNMEYKSSHYDYELQQAQQAADAGVEWAAERIYLQLLTTENDSDLPPACDFQPNNQPQKIGPNPTALRVASFEISNWQAVLTSGVKSNPAVYEIISTGNFSNAHRTIKVRIAYWYEANTVGSETDARQGRDFSANRGYISSYRIQ